MGCMHGFPHVFQAFANVLQLLADYCRKLNARLVIWNSDRSIL